MKVSLNWAQEYSNVDLKPDSIDDLVQKIGAQLGAVEAVEHTGEKYSGAVVVRVVSCQKHPNADKLTVCLIDDGGAVADVERNDGGFIEVVCGAPNVREALFAVWLPPGCTVPSTFAKKPVVLDARELRGVKSNGMLASPQELDLADNHSGIHEIDPTEVGEESARPGVPFKKLYGLDDVIIDIENKMFTHRPDCFGVLGAAREIAGIQQMPFKSPDWYLNRRDDDYGQTDLKGRLAVGIRNELPDLVPRFIALSIQDVQVKPSPMWLQAGLQRVGIKPINNIVDITNYVSYITGQPLHAYDYDKVRLLDYEKNPVQEIASPEAEAQRKEQLPYLVIRHPKPGEKIKLLNGKEIEPRPEAIMIATEKQLIGIGGVMGGTSTEVDNDTKNIILECANFDMYSIRRTSMAHGLFTDAVTRFTKGQSPLQNDIVVSQALYEVKKLAGGIFAGLNDESHLEDKVFGSKTQIHDPVIIDADFINARLGLNLGNDEIIKLLTNVEFDAYTAAGQINVNAPFWRTDIVIPEDVVEEVGRLHGFDKLPLELPKRNTAPARPDAKLELKQKLRTSLASFGANEVLTYSFVDGQLLQKADQNKDLAFKLSNALSPDLQYYRVSLTPSLLSKVNANIKAGHNEFSIFEINKTHITLHKDDDNGVPKELEMVTLVTASKTDKSSGFYKARAYLDSLAASLGAKLRYEAIPEELNFEVTAPFDHSRSAFVFVEGNDTLLGIAGEYKYSVANALKLPSHCAGFEIGLEALMAINTTNNYEPLSRYPSTSQDICLEVDSGKTYGEVTSALSKALKTHTSATQRVNWQPIDIYQAAESNKKRITYRVTVTSYERTLTDDVLSELLDQIVGHLNEQTGAVRI